MKSETLQKLIEKIDDFRDQMEAEEEKAKTTLLPKMKKSKEKKNGIDGLQHIKDTKSDYHAVSPSH